MRPKKWFNIKRSSLPPPITLDSAQTSRAPSPDMTFPSRIFQGISKRISKKSQIRIPADAQPNRLMRHMQLFGNQIRTEAININPQDKTWRKATESSALRKRSARLNSLETIDDCSLPSATGTMELSEDREQKEFIKRILSGNVYLHPSFVFAYKPQYCVHRGDYGFTCIYQSTLNEDDFVSVKFLNKSHIPSFEWVVWNGRQVPKELMKYLTKEDKELPLYRFHYEDTDWFYIITEVHGDIKAKEEQTIVEKITKGLIGEPRYAVNWEAHFH